MTSATITIDGKPRGKGRPRFVRATGGTYTDNKTAAYEQYIKTLWLSNVGQRFDGELYVHICAYYPIPASKPKKTQAAMREGIIRPSVKPDIDNVVKAVLDGLNGVAFKDDNQVIELVAEKWYSDEPRVTVSVMQQIGRMRMFVLWATRVVTRRAKNALNDVKMRNKGGAR